MQQVVQSVGNGSLRVVEVPAPTAGPAEVLVATTRSLLSTGTEKAVRELASASLIDKAKARPDQVRQVLKKAKIDGIRSTVQAVRTKLDEDMPLGYSAAGIAREVGTSATRIVPGMRVATASAGHASIQLVPSLLTVPIPDSVTDEAAAFGAVGAIAMQGLRQADVQFGGTVAVIGLGLVGQLTVRMALAAGLKVVGVDLRAWTVDLARQDGAVGLVESGQDTTDAILAETRGRGVDAVLVTASTKSSDPVMAAVERVRDRGVVVVVGDIGLQLQRTPFYMKEVDLRFARSYGPGRYERNYEEHGLDYPIGQVRWTEGRNIEAYLDMVASGRLKVDDLVTHVFDINDFEKAYATISNDPTALAVQFSYPVTEIDRRPVLVHSRTSPQTKGSGIIGAGNYAKMTFLPAMASAGLPPAIAVTSSSGITARHLAERHGIQKVLADVPSMLADADVDTVFVLSRHDSHAAITKDALKAGKHVFVEKPLALSEDELDAIVEVAATSNSVLWGGFNRRHSEAIRRTRATLSGSCEPLVLTYRVAAGRLPETHWYKDRLQGGRLLGEVCHFIDLCSWVVGRPVEAITAFGDGNAEGVLQENIVVSMRFADGSLATVTYSEHPHPSAPKERLEILGRGHAVVVDDFSRVSIDGKDMKIEAKGKGHVENLRLFAAALNGENDGVDDLRATIGSTAAALAAVASLQFGSQVRVDSRVGDAPFARG